MVDNLGNKIDKALSICKDRYLRDSFELIYPYTTENIAGYLPYFDLKDKSLLTVGSSSDQVFNSVLCGCSDVTVFDICPFVKEYFNLKKAAISELSRKEFLDFFSSKDSLFSKKSFSKDVYIYLRDKLKDIDYESYMFWEKLFKKIDALTIRNKLFKNDEYNKKIICIINDYLKNDLNYEMLQSKINDVSVNFNCGNLFKNEIDGKYDNIFFSNVFVYNSLIETFDLFNKTLSSLNDNGNLLVCYIYFSFLTSGYFRELIEIFYDYGYVINFGYIDGIEKFKSHFGDYKDAVMVYNKSTEDKVLKKTKK